MVDENKPNPGWKSNIVKGFQKSWAWIVAVVSVLIAYGPDVASLILEQIGLITTVFPSLSIKAKAVLLLIGHLGVIFLRPIKQPRWMRPEEGVTQPVVSVKIPESIVIEPGGAPLEVEVERHDRTRADPGPPS